MKKSRDEIKRLQEAKDYDALEKCLMTRMQFGTAGKVHFYYTFDKQND